MKTKILASQILAVTGLGQAKADAICIDYFKDTFDAQQDPISNVILKAFDDNVGEDSHEQLISDIKHTIHQLQNAVKFIEGFSEDDELLKADTNHFCK